ncbi:MAG: hypothetical protein Q9M44_07915, partial [Ghiorsea sp.]|nr:hypothetical protein [Ghiorsea sp.]
ENSFMSLLYDSIRFRQVDVQFVFTGGAMLYHQHNALRFKEGVADRDNSIDRAKGVASIAMTVMMVVLFHLSHGQVFSTFESTVTFLYYVLPSVFLFLFALVLSRPRGVGAVIKRFAYMFVLSLIIDALYRYLTVAPLLYSVYINFALAALIVPASLRLSSMALSILLALLVLLVSLHAVGLNYVGDPSQWLFADRFLSWRGMYVLQYPLLLFLFPVLYAVLYKRTEDKAVLGAVVFVAGIFAYILNTKGVQMGWVAMPAYGLHEVLFTTSFMGVVLWMLRPRLPLVFDMLLLPLGRNVFLTFVLVNLLLVVSFFAIGWSFSYGYVGYQPQGWLGVDDLPFDVDYKYYLIVSFFFLALSFLLARALESIKWRRGMNRAVNEMPVPKL